MRFGIRKCYRSFQLCDRTVLISTLLSIANHERYWLSLSGGDETLPVPATVRSQSCKNLSLSIRKIDLLRVARCGSGAEFLLPFLMSFGRPIMRSFYRLDARLLGLDTNRGCTCPSISLSGIEESSAISV